MVETSPMISVEELAAEQAAADPPIVVDLRWYLGKPGAGRAAYLEGHIPGAIFLDLDDDLADPNGLGAPGRHPLPSPAAFATRMAEAGIGDGTRVVGYDDVGGWVAARLWWMLDNLGFGRRGDPRESVRVLDGGIKAWVDAGRPLASGEERWVAAARLQLSDRWHGVIERHELRERLGDVTLLDARGAPRYRGETEPIDPVAGHIPGARNLPYTDGAGVPDDLVSTEDEVVVYCGSGITAAVDVLALERAGVRARLYPGSWSEWSARGLPVERG
jgi:thiosulfate/3-mercaptopyruvate sulfurtransferase